jgi:DNA uptake protein ComE-like DNA-binding protein
MNSYKESLMNWFGYTRRERRSTFILLIIIAVVIGIRFVVPENRIDLTVVPMGYQQEKAGSDSISEPVGLTRKPVKKESYYRRQEGPIDLNRCDSASLVSLPGIGPVLSARIIKYRKLIGGFVSVGQLREVYGLPEETYDLVSPRLMADPASVRKIKINSAGYGELIRHPYFRREEVAAILKYRELKGSIPGVGEMVENKVISEETAGKIAAYLEF